MKKTALSIFLILLSACSTVHYRVTSEPDAAVIEVNNQQVCDHTPCEFDLKCNSWKRGLTLVSATPKSGAGTAYTNSKIIDVCDASDGKGALVFNLRLEPVNPTTPIQIKK